MFVDLELSSTVLLAGRKNRENIVKRSRNIKDYIWFREINVMKPFPEFISNWKKLFQM